MSTYSQTRTTGNVANDAEFRVWGKFLSDSMESAGWLKTADTGQINWATVTRPVATNTAAGYEIRKSPTQGGYTDFYLKIEYGSGSNVAYPAVWFTIGTGSDGAGTLTGTVSTRYQRPPSTLASAAEDLVSGGDNWLALMWCVATTGASAGGGIIVFERLTDADGNHQTDGIAVHSFSNNAATCFSMTSGGVNSVQTKVVIGYIPPGYAGTAGTVFVAPAMPNAPGAHYPMRALCFVGNGNTGSGQTHSFAMFPGKTQTWRGAELETSDAYTTADTPGNISFVIRWE